MTMSKLLVILAIALSAIVMAESSKAFTKEVEHVGGEYHVEGYGSGSLKSYPAQEMLGYYPREDERQAPRMARDTATLDASYDQYLCNGACFRRFDWPPGDDARMIGMDGRTGYSGRRQEEALPPDASNTVFGEGLASNCTRREVSHIVRPFVGFERCALSIRSRDIPEVSHLCYALLILLPQARLQLHWKLCKE